MEADVLLSLVISPEVEDAIVDWLLQQEQIGGFTSLQVSGHGSSPHSMSVSEQVAGRRRQVMFQLQLPLATAQDIVAAVRASFGGSGMHYWLMPVLASGHLR